MTSQSVCKDLNNTQYQKYGFRYAINRLYNTEKLKEQDTEKKKN